MKITSIKDPNIIAARLLNRAVNRKLRCLLEGETIVSWALLADIEIEHVFVSDNYLFKDTELFNHITTRKVAIYRCSDGVMKKINESRHLIPVIGVAKLPQATDSKKQPLMLVLDDLHDQGNIGTIVRTGAAFGVKSLVLSGRSQDIYNKKTITASRGQVFSIIPTKSENTLQALKQLKRRGYQVVATSPRGGTLQSLSKLEAKPVALVVGNESMGSSQAVLDEADITIKIPMQNEVESLNVGVATGISLYELKIKVIIAMLTEHIRSTLGRELGVAHQLVQQVLDAELAKVCDYTAKQIILLMVMVCDKHMALTQIEHDIKMSGEDLELILQPLLADDIVKEERDGYRVSANGEALLGKLWNVIEKSENLVLDGFNESEKQQLKDMLSRVQKNCEGLLSPDH